MKVDEKNAVKCPVCKKVIGRMVLDGVTECGGFIGSIPCYHQELDYRKASHTYSNGLKQHGTLCRGCAKKAYPEGKRYKVCLRHVNKVTAIIGEDGSYFHTRQNAIEACDRMNAKCYPTHYWVVEEDI